MRWLVILLAAAAAACAKAPAAPRAAPNPATGGNAPDVETTSIEILHHNACIGEKDAPNVVSAKDGQCLCYDPPWEGGTRPPDEHERATRHDFDGVFLCHASPGVPPSSAVDQLRCPITQPVPGTACSAHEQMLRNGYCLYVAADMKTLVHFRCDAEHWREVADDEVQRERMNRP